ncbi:MAG: rRNA maturation RNase YbeY [bacterium]|nr:rRNA maturation RNase YbeY [bacterium]
MIMLLIKNLTKSKVDEKFFRSIAGKTLENLPKLAKSAKKIEISLVIIGEKRMKGLNRIWRGKNKATDVLSFENQKNKFNFIAPPDDIIHLGQIFICYPVASRQARQYGYSIREEAARLLIHGILHLAGYDHEKNADQEKKMLGLQEKILGKIIVKKL